MRVSLSYVTRMPGVLSTHIMRPRPTATKAKTYPIWTAYRQTRPTEVCPCPVGQNSMKCRHVCHWKLVSSSVYKCFWNAFSINSTFPLCHKTYLYIPNRLSANSSNTKIFFEVKKEYDVVLEIEALIVD